MNRLSLCDMKNRFLYEVWPSEFPEGELSDTEVQLWSMYYDHKERQIKSKR